MNKSTKGAIGAFSLAGVLFGLSGQARAADTLAQDMTASTSPLPSLSCLYVSEWNGSAFVDRSRCSNYAVWLGAVALNGALGTPTSGTLTNLVGLPIVGGTSGTLSVVRGGTGQTTYTNGQMLIGNSATGSLDRATLTAGANVTITNSAGGITIAAAGGGGGGGTPAGSNGDWQTNNAGSFGSFTPAAGIQAWATTPSSANLLAAMTSKTGTGNLVFATAPTLAAPVMTAPVLGTPASGVMTNVTGLPLSGLVTQAANTLVANVTSGSASPTAVAIPACTDTGGQHLNYSGSTFSCGTSGDGAGGGSPVNVSDGTHTVNGVASITFDPAVYLVGGSAGASTVTSTSTVTADKSAADYTILTTDANKIIPVGSSHTYSLPQAGSAGFGDGWGPCFQNVSTTGSASIVTAGSSLFKGAGNLNFVLLPAQAWACITAKSTDWITQVGYGNTLPGAFYLAGTVGAPALTGNVNDFNPAGLNIASALYLDAGAADRTITGLAGGAEGRIIAIINAGVANNLTISNSDAASTAANRFLINSNITIPPNESRVFRYDIFSQRYRALGANLANTGVTSGSYNCTNLTVGTDGRISSAANGSCAGGGGSGITAAFAPIGWIAAIDPNKAVIMTATTAMTVTAIRGRVADAVGAAATVTVNKAPSGTACSSGTAQHSGSFNANGTASTNQTLTLVGGAPNSLAAGDSLCIVTTGGANWTSGVGIGGVTVTYTVP